MPRPRNSTDKPQIFSPKVPKKTWRRAPMDEIKEPSMKTTCLFLWGHLRKNLHGKCPQHPSFCSPTPSWLSEAFFYLPNPKKFSQKEIFKSFLFITWKWKMQWGWIWLGFFKFQFGYQMKNKQTICIAPEQILSDKIGRYKYQQPTAIIKINKNWTETQSYWSLLKQTRAEFWGCRNSFGFHGWGRRSTENMQIGQVFHDMQMVRS